MCYMLDQHVQFDKTLLELKNQIEAAAEAKMKSSGVKTELLKEKTTRKSR